MAAPVPRIALIWAQLSAYHVDRLEAVGHRLADRAEVLAVEVASRSTTYAWEPSGDVRGTTKVRLFADRDFETIPWLRRLWAMVAAVRGCRMVFVGVAYSAPDILLLSLLLRLLGKTVVMMTASKFDDRPRHVFKEWLKRLALSCFSAALVGGCRQYDYVRFLGFRRRRVLAGYNTVSMERVRAMAGDGVAPFAARPFLYVGRFVSKKNLETILAGYADYLRKAGSAGRDLVLAGDGPLRPELETLCASLGIANRVRFTGFVDARTVARLLAESLALVLVSVEEQWGLVVNEALAVGVPVIASYEVGAREALVVNLGNGFVVRRNSIQGIAAAMARIAANESGWREMSIQSRKRSWLADTERFADAVELMVFPGIEPAQADHDRFTATILSESARWLPTEA